MDNGSLAAPVSFTSEDARIQRLPNYLSLAALAKDVLHLKRTATHAVTSRPNFPAPIELGGRHRLWVTAEVLAWVDQQPRLFMRPVPTSLAEVRRYRDGRLVAGARTEVARDRLGQRSEQV